MGQESGGHWLESEKKSDAARQRADDVTIES